MQVVATGGQFTAVWGLTKGSLVPQFIGGVDLTQGPTVTVYTSERESRSFTHRELGAALEWLMQQWAIELSGCILGRYFTRDPEALTYESIVIAAAV